MLELKTEKYIRIRQRDNFFFGGIRSGRTQLKKFIIYLNNSTILELLVVLLLPHSF